MNALNRFFLYALIAASALTGAESLRTEWPPRTGLDDESLPALARHIARERRRHDQLSEQSRAVRRRLEARRQLAGAEIRDGARRGAAAGGGVAGSPAAERHPGQGDAE